LTKVFLIRHAEAEGNIYRRAHGHYNGLITVNGFLQIEQLKKRFADEEICAVYSSDLSRTCSTAKAVSEPRELEIQTSPMLREVDMGVWEDSAWGDIEYHFPEMYNNFTYDPDKWDVKGGEEYETIKKRMFDFICEKAEQHDGESIAVFSHGFAIRALISKLSDIPSHETRKVPYCDNTAVALLNYESGSLSIEYHGDNSHLNENISTMAKQTWWRKAEKHINPSLRFMPLDEVADETLIQIFHGKIGERARVDIQYIAFRADNPVGIVGLDTVRDRHRNFGWLKYLHVLPSQRDNTYGTQLLGIAISDFRKLRREKMLIDMPAGSLAIDFMSKYGFNILDTDDKNCLMEKDIRNW